MTRLRVFLATLVVVLAFAPSAAAHIVVVSPAGEGNGTVRWVGAGSAAHSTGLVHACMATMGNPSAAALLAPPSFTGCQHGT